MADIKTIKMARDPAQYPAPHEADVHPDEVENYRTAGFVEVESEAKDKGQKAGDKKASNDKAPAAGDDANAKA
jgi:hypothetical protein